MSCLDEAGLDADDVVRFHLDGGQVSGCLYQSGNVLAHGKYAVRAGIEGLKQSAGRVAVDGFGAEVLRFHNQLQVGVNDVVFSLYLSCKHVQVTAQGMFVGFGDGDDGMCLAGNGVAQVSSLNFAQIEVVLGSSLAEEAVQNLVGIAQSQVDVATRVSAFQSFHLNLAAEVSGRDIGFLILELGYGVHAAGTADEEFAFVFGVEVQQDVAVHESFFQRKGSGQSRFFVDGEQAFQRTVLNGVVGQNSQFGGYADAVIGSQCCAFGFQPFPVHFRLNGIVHEVVLHVVVLFADHVDMRLQDNGLAVFHTRSGRLTNNNIADLVDKRLQSKFFAEVHQKFGHFFYMP